MREQSFLKILLKNARTIIINNLQFYILKSCYFHLIHKYLSDVPAKGTSKS